MLALVKGTRPFMRCFEPLAKQFTEAPPAAFFDYVLAHEHAIADVGNRVLGGDRSSLVKVEALLGNAP